jgi:hypothetical protein
MIVIAVLDAAVGDGDAMGVAPKIGEDLGGHAERLLGVDDPSGAAHIAVQLDMPPVRSAADVSAAMEALVSAMTAGFVSPDDAQTIAAVIDAQRRAIETTEFEARLRALEAKVETNEQGD